MEDANCMDVVSCRLNAFMVRLRPISIGRSLDEQEPVGKCAHAYFEWLWVDVYGLNEDGWQGAPKLNKLYGRPHL